MSVDPTTEAAQMAALAGGAGGVARVLMAIHGGVRKWQMLLLEFGLGGVVGLLVAALALMWDAELRHVGYPMLIVGGLCGGGGAIGIKILDIVTDAVQRRLNGDRPNGA